MAQTFFNDVYVHNRAKFIIDDERGTDGFSTQFFLLLSHTGSDQLKNFCFVPFRIDDEMRLSARVVPHSCSLCATYIPVNPIGKKQHRNFPFCQVNKFFCAQPIIYLKCMCYVCVFIAIAHWILTQGNKFFLFYIICVACDPPPDTSHSFQTFISFFYEIQTEMKFKNPQWELRI